MGPHAALTSELRVHGTESLWVADASAMPLVPFGNSTCPVVVLAEKASDLILTATR
jgi:choline dehydrogenase